MGTGEFHAGGNPAMECNRIQGGREILIVANATETEDKHRIHLARVQLVFMCLFAQKKNI